MKTRLHAIFAAISSAILMDVDETTFVNVQMRIHISLVILVGDTQKTGILISL
jgi:hypothetical protein